MEKYIQLFKENPQSYLKEAYLKKVQPELYNNIVQFATDNNLNLKFSQKVYHYLYQLIDMPKCKTCCTNIPVFNTATTGYNKFCSTKCSKLNEETNTKYKETLLKTYGTTDVLNSKNNLEKKKLTMLEKYGVDNYSKTEEFKQNQINHNQEKYGVDHTFQLDSFKEKSKITNLEKRGVDHHTKTDEFKNTMNLNTPEVQESAKQTLIRKYGYDNPRTSKLLIENLMKAGLDIEFYDKDTDTYEFKCEKGHIVKMTKSIYEEKVKNNTLKCSTCKK